LIVEQEEGAAGGAKKGNRFLTFLWTLCATLDETCHQQRGTLSGEAVQRVWPLLKLARKEKRAFPFVWMSFLVTMVVKGS
jgi:hypothetical protein